jgi:methylmalonyl-CoA/ethylmalonyl-CoA epimerase
MEIDHIAIAVPNLAEAIKRFTDDLGLTLSGQETVTAAQTDTAFFPVNAHRIELISPLDGQGPVQKFINKRRGGLHHVCFVTDDLLAKQTELKSKGYRFINDTPTAGAHNSQVLWIHPDSTDGLLIELVQHTPAS